MLLSEALPVLVHKPQLLVLTANYCTLGLMIGRLKSAPAGEPPLSYSHASVYGHTQLSGTKDLSYHPGSCNSAPLKPRQTTRSKVSGRRMSVL